MAGGFGALSLCGGFFQANGLGGMDFLSPSIGRNIEAPDEDILDDVGISRELKLGPELAGRRLRFTIPSALCFCCLGETWVGEEYLKGNYKKMKWD